jgi:proteasome accessory factor C
MNHLQRQLSILSHLRTGRGHSTLSDLATAYATSEKTIRRDVAALADEGHRIVVTCSRVVYHEAGAVDSLAGAEDELLAKIAAFQHLDSLGCAAWEDEIASTAARLESEVRNIHGHPVQRWRFRVSRGHLREVSLAVYRAVVYATHARRQVIVSYASRSSCGTRTYRISPQAVSRWREAHYLYGICHAREDAPVDGSQRMSFALDRITSIDVLHALAEDLPQDDVEAELGTSYGAFVGRPTDWATIRFSQRFAQYATQWHAHQRTTRNDDGTVDVCVPYADSTELVAAILAQGEGVEVLSPDSLRREVRATVERVVAIYR